MDVDFSQRYFDITDRRKANEKFVSWYYELGLDDNAYRIGSCCNYWDWDVFQKNKILKFEGVYRCKDRFCANCAKIRVIKSLRDFVPKFIQLLDQGYVCYMVTLTIPNVKELDVDFLSHFRQRVKEFNQKFTSGKNAIKDRPFNIAASVYSIEITRNADRGDWHPHIHGLIFLDSTLLPSFVDKTIPDGYSKRETRQINRSRADEYIRKVWTAVWQRKDIRTAFKTFTKPSQWLRADIRPADYKAPFEVFKYMIKHTSINSYDEFKTLHAATYRKKLFQAYGELYNLKVDQDDEDDSREIDPEKYDLFLQMLVEDPEEEPYRDSFISVEDISVRYGQFKKVNIKKTLSQKLAELKKILSPK